MNYTPLYIYSEYSMLHSTCHVEDIIKKAKEYNLKSLAVTDLGVMHGALKLYRSCKEAGIKYIFGLKVDYIINDVKSSILLYAINLNGYHNLLKISSKYMINKKPLDIEDFRSINQGLIAVTCGCENIISNFNDNDIKYLMNHISILESIFSNLYIGLTTNNLSNKYQLFTSFHKKMVALLPTYFINPEDKEAYRVLRSIANNAMEVRLTKEEEEAYFTSPTEACFLFRDYKELIVNTEEIANRCNVDIKFGELQIPLYKENIDSRQYLLELSTVGLKKRLSINGITDSNIKDNYFKRLRYELDTINDMGFNDYFLIVYDFIKYSKKSGIYVGPGRGSAGASLVAYSLGITEVDPLKYGLIFERFLNRERISMPDIDVDFPDNRRDEVIDYVRKLYGANRVAHICTFGTFQTKLAINDTARVYKTKDNYLKQVLKYINSELNENRDRTLIDIIANSTDLKELMKEYEEINQLLSTAQKIYNLPRNTSTHTAGIVISRYDLINYSALETGLNDIYQTQYEASDIEQLGLLKMDFLSLKNLSNIAKTIDLIKKDNPKFIFPKEENDPNVFKMLAKGQTIGVFQLESNGMRKVLMQLKPTSLIDIINVLALYRPGPMDIIPNFINRKFGREKIEYLHETLIPVLKDTYGLIVYQEQILQIAVRFAGYSLGRADVLRKAVSKKKKEILEKERIDFVNGALSLGHKEEDANKIYDYIVQFASYGFNKAHAVVYAKVAYQTAYLKYYYPNYYLATLFTSVLGSDADIKMYCRESLRNNINVYYPNINYSQDEFIPVEKGILFPLSIIRGLGSIKTQELLKERSKDLFKDFKDFIVRTRSIIPLSIVSNIIYSGALDNFNLTKKAMIETAQLHLDMVEYIDLPGIREIEYPTDEYSYGELQLREKEAIGINIKYDFFVQYENIYVERGLQRIKDLRLDSYVHTIGLIDKVRITKTKKDEEMAIFILSDNMSEIDCVIFPTTLKNNPDLASGIIAEVVGNVKINNKNNLPQIVVESIKKI